jgi:coenzyme F420-0:L-glutamate ligase/coenzyme F420-1:gamma-L-glutamate ligase
MSIQIFPIKELPIIKEGDDLAKFIIASTEKMKIQLKDDDIIVICHVIVSRAEGNIIDLKTITPSTIAQNYADFTGKDPRLVEVILRESKAIRRMSAGVLITETKHGFICANSGVDKSNVPGEYIVAPLPVNPDLSATKIRKKICVLKKINVAVIICDTHGRPHRDGEINVAIGVSGLEAIRDRRGEKDLFGYELKVKRTAIADELASAAELVIGQADEAVPAAIIRGYKYKKSEKSTIKDLIRPREKDLFI